MLKEVYELRIYEVDYENNHKEKRVGRVLYDCNPGTKEIEKMILKYAGCNGIGEVVKRYRPDVPFA